MAFLTECIKGGSREDFGKGLQHRPGWLIRFGYETNVVESLKAKVPHTKREWREDERRWWVSDGYEEALRLIFGNFRSLAYDQMRMF